ncbi:MAG: hypothetical protein J7578_17780, partial [Chitinophagaceae bacterium]|nr:hypothetical protein [Chitinophagaceae bacterium]
MLGISSFLTYLNHPFNYLIFLRLGKITGFQIFEPLNRQRAAIVFNGLVELKFPIFFCLCVSRSGRIGCIEIETKGVPGNQRYLIIYKGDGIDDLLNELSTLLQIEFTEILPRYIELTGTI